jgi:excisionase family DNA binding protein
MAKSANMSVPAVGKRLGISRQRVLQLIEEQELKAEKVGRQWIVRSSAVEAYQAAKMTKVRKRGTMPFPFDLDVDAVENFLKHCSDVELDPKDAAAEALNRFVAAK